MMPHDSPAAYRAWHEALGQSGRQAGLARAAVKDLERPGAKWADMGLPQQRRVLLAARYSRTVRELAKKHGVSDEDMQQFERANPK